MQFKHKKQLTGLTPDTLYHYRITSKDMNGIGVASDDYTFTTSVESSTSTYHAPAPTNSLVVNVTNTGATGNGTTDDTLAIQAAIDQVAGTGGTVLVPSGTYIVDINPVYGSFTSLRLKNSMTFKMESGAVIKLKTPNNYGSYYILESYSASNVNIVGGTIDGNRDGSTATGGEWGMGVSVNGGSNIYIESVISKNCWGDGFYITGNAKNVNFYSVVSDYARRVGFGIIWTDGVVIRDSIIKNTRGTAPAAGIDIEPNNTSQLVNNVQILNSQFINNQNQGIELFGKFGPITNVTISGNTLTGNNDGINISNTNGNTITNNTIVDKYVGVDFNWGGASGNIVTGNNITAPNFILRPEGNIISGNTYTAI